MKFFTERYQKTRGNIEVSSVRNKFTKRPHIAQKKKPQESPRGELGRETDSTWTYTKKNMNKTNLK